VSHPVEALRLGCGHSPHRDHLEAVLAVAADFTLGGTASLARSPAAEKNGGGPAPSDNPPLPPS